MKSSGSDGKKVYQARASDCEQCPLRSRCTKSDQGRSVNVDAGEPVRQRMNEKMQNPESKEVYKERKTIVEPVFGVIKSNMGFAHFSLRGLKKVSGEFSLVCWAYNIKKIVKKAFLKGEVCPNSGIQGAKVVELEENGTNLASSFAFLLLRFVRESLTILLVRFGMYAVSYNHG